MGEETVRKKKEGSLERGAKKAALFFKGLLGQAKKAKASIESRQGIKPLLSLESRLTIPKIRKLIDLISDRFVPKALPSLTGKIVLEIGETPLHFQKLISEKKPQIFCGVIVGNGALKASPSPSPFLVKGSFKAIPFDAEYFDSVICSLTTPCQEDVVSAFKEVGRVLLPDGFGLILDFHPFGMYAKTGTERLRSHQATIRGVEDYYKMCRVSGLSIVDLAEGFLDDTLRSLFASSEETSLFRELKGTPLVLFLVVTKLRRKG